MSLLTENTVPALCRFRDLCEAGIVKNWPQLKSLVEDHGFPVGFQLSPNTRAWRVDDVRQWLAARPVERKPLIPRRNRTDQAAGEAA
jgi:hypothetical protein